MIFPDKLMNLWCERSPMSLQDQLQLHPCQRPQQLSKQEERKRGTEAAPDSKVPGSASRNVGGPSANTGGVGASSLLAPTAAKGSGNIAMVAGLPPGVVPVGKRSGVSFSCSIRYAVFCEVFPAAFVTSVTISGLQC